MNKLLNSIEKKNNRSVTTVNGAISNASTLSECVDFFARGGALRGATIEDRQNSFSRAFSENKAYALRIALYLRDIRGGQGERQTFRDILIYLANNQEDVCNKLIPYVSEFGRVDDLYSFKDTDCWGVALAYIVRQLEQDWQNYNAQKPISLFPKWAASTNTSSPKTVAIGFEIAKEWNLTPKQYRQRLSAMRKYLDVVERKISANEWSNIDYSKIPSNASLLYRKAFSRHDGERYTEFLKKVEKGEVKINAATLYPYDIVKKVRVEGDKTANALWNNLPNYFNDGQNHNGLVVCDVSGSMMSGMGSVAPIDVSISLAIYFAERNNGDFKNYFITYSAKPKLIKLVGNNISEKYRNLTNDSGNFGYHTNIQAVFDLILSRAEKDKIAQEDMPETIYIVSDCEFDHPQNGSKTNFQIIKKKYKKSGYKMPQLVFWNVNAQNKQFPATINDDGVCLVSGCSPSILGSVLGSDEINPVKIMEKTILKEKYDVVEQILS